MNVERIGSIGDPEFREYFVRPRVPVVLTNAVDRWPARDRWSLAFFHKHYGHRQVRFRSQHGQMKLADYLDRLAESSFEHPAPYLRNLNIQTDWPDLIPDISPRVSFSQPDWLSSRLMPRDWPRPRHLNQLFISGKGAKISLHYDDWMTHNFVSNVVGEKEFMLFAPHQGRFLYPMADQYLVSGIPDPFDVDPVAFPEFAHTTPTRVTIGPGESLFVPCGWWHTTRTLSTCISISSSFVNRDNWASMVDEIAVMRASYGGAQWKTRLMCLYLACVGGALSTGARIGDVMRAASISNHPASFLRRHRGPGFASGHGVSERPSQSRLSTGRPSAGRVGKRRGAQSGSDD